MGQSDDLRPLGFKRPTFYPDIEHTIGGDSTRTILILVDTHPDASGAPLEEWLNMFRRCRIFIACRGDGHDALSDNLPRRMNTDGFSTVNLQTWEGGQLPIPSVKALAALVPQPSIIVSCSPYDSFGVFVKKDLERSLLPLLRKWRALYFIHDPVYRTVRVVDSRLMKDRLVWRPIRLKIYEMIVRWIYRICRLCSNITTPVWRRVRL